MLELKSPFDVFFQYFFASTVVLLALWFNFLPLRRGEVCKSRSGELLPGPGARWVSTEQKLFTQIILFIEPQITAWPAYLANVINIISKLGISFFLFSFSRFGPFYQWEFRSSGKSIDQFLYRKFHRGASAR